MAILGHYNISLSDPISWSLCPLFKREKLFKSYEVVYSAPSDKWVYKVYGPMTDLQLMPFSFSLGDPETVTELKSRLWFPSSNTCISDALTVNVPWYTNADPKPKICNYWLTFLENAAREEPNHTMYAWAGDLFKLVLLLLCLGVTWISRC